MGGEGGVKGVKEREMKGGERGGERRGEGGERRGKEGRGGRGRRGKGGKRQVLYTHTMILISIHLVSYEQ